MKALSETQQRVLVSLVEGAGTTQRFGRWSRASVDALQRAGLVTVTMLETPPDCYALARVDLTWEGKVLRDALMFRVESIPFPEYRKYPREEMCWHDPGYPVGEWRCPLRKYHADFHRYIPVELINWADERCLLTHPQLRLSERLHHPDPRRHCQIQRARPRRLGQDGTHTFVSYSKKRERADARRAG
jgi:hypothetical protein